MPSYFTTALFTICCIQSETPSEPIAPGAPAPAWQSLTGVDGKQHSLSALAKSKVVVVAFTCNECPYAQRYEERFVNFSKAYADQPVSFVAINVNTGEDEDLSAMKERATTQNFPFPYLCDPTQEIGRRFGAKVTPQVYVLDQDRRVAYMGAFDNNSRQERVTEEYVRQAVDSLLMNKQPAVKSTRPAGCSIRYE